MKGTHRFMYRDGERVAVIRPEDPAKAISLAHRALVAQDVDGFERLPAEVGPYTFVGWLSRDGMRAIDDHGKAVGDLQPGDSFVHPSSVERAEPCAG